LANLKHAVETSSKLEWKKGLVETRINGELHFSDPLTQISETRIGALEKAFYKPQCSGETKKKCTSDDQKLTVRRSFRLWLDKVTGVEEKGLSQKEEIQKKDLKDESKCARPFCTSVNGTANALSCGLCGPRFIPKYKALRLQKRYFSNGTEDTAYRNPYTGVTGGISTMSYGDFKLTNNERMVMCACYKGVGPYADSENGFQSIRQLAALYSIVSGIYSILVNSTLFSWLVGASLMILLLFSKNSAKVSTDYAADQRFYFSDQISGLNKRNQNLQKKYNRLRMAVDS